MVARVVMHTPTAVSIFIFFAIVLLFFFFQAEDGIRDVAVTGVQTCALPISSTVQLPSEWAIGILRIWPFRAALVKGVSVCSTRICTWRQMKRSPLLRIMEIGRASCRERV